MQKSNSKASPTGQLDLGSVLGQSQAFGLVAGRCSAAQAACLHRLRKGNAFQLVTPRWREFCSEYLGVSGRSADKIIRLWEEFGAPYFELAQLTRIPPDTYRALAPTIHDGALHLNGEVVELLPENSRRLAAAVSNFRRTIPRSKPTRQLDAHQQLDTLDERAMALIAELQALSFKERRGEDWLHFTGILARLSAALNRIKRENGLH